MSRLAVTRLGLSHFRSHARADVSLDGRPVAIHGPNGAGKTNLVEAVSLLSPGRGLRRAAGEDLARRPESIGWKVTARLDGPGGRHDVETTGEGGGRQVEIDGKAAAQSALGAIVRVLWLTPSMDRLWMEGASERRRFLDRTALSLSPITARRCWPMRRRCASATGCCAIRCGTRRGTGRWRRRWRGRARG